MDGHFFREGCGFERINQQGLTSFSSLCPPQKSVRPIESTAGQTTRSATPFDSRVEELSRDFNLIAQEALRLQQRSETLQRKLFEAHIAQSSYRVHKLEEEMRIVWRNPILYRQIIQGRLPLLFERDGATLQLIIRDAPELAPKAQAVLDQIAILMGFISDQPSPCPLRRVPPDLP